MSPRFGDIFRGNAGKGGLLHGLRRAAGRRAAVAALEADPATEVTVDLDAAHRVLGRRTSVPFDIDDYTRWRLMEGLDDIGLTLRHADEIAAFEASRPSWLPTTV